MIMLESLSKREKNLINILLAFILIALIYWGFGRVLFPKYAVVAHEIEGKKSELEETRALIAMLPNLEEEYLQLKEDADRLKIPMNTEVRNGINYYFIGQHAVDNNIIITQVNPKPLDSNQAVLKIPFEIRVRGYYQDIVNFIRLVEQDMPNTSELLSLQLHPYVEDEETKDTAKNQKTTNDNADKTSQGNKENVEKEEKKESKDTSPADYQDPVIVGNNPVVVGVLNIVTYMVRSPENLQLAQESIPLGRFDAFNPTVDVPANPVGTVGMEESETVVTDENLSAPEMDPIFDDSGDPFATKSSILSAAAPSASAKPKGAAGPEIETEKEGKTPTAPVNKEKASSPVPEVFVKETGDYSFPVRE